MKLIADSGGSKTDWRLCNSEKIILAFRTRGYNPMFISTSEIVDDLTKALQETGIELKVTELHFYGAGCSSPDRVTTLMLALTTVFPNAAVYVKHDMLGAGIAAWGDGEGIVGILGTGSNACIYSDGKIISDAPSYGFIFGDEGGGADLAKHFFHAYFKDRLPADLVEALEREYDKGKAQFLDHIYQTGSMNKTLAGYCTFLGKYSDHEFVKRLLRERFQAYVDAWIKIFPEHKYLQVKMIGSIAKYFQKELLAVFEGNKIDFAGVSDQPIDGLVEYHLTSDSNS